MKSREAIRKKRNELAQRAYRSPREEYVERPGPHQKMELLDWVLDK